jgi:hypothetical protein
VIAPLIAAGSLLSPQDPRYKVPGSVYRLELVAQEHERRIQKLDRRTSRGARKGERRLERQQQQRLRPHTAYKILLIKIFARLEPPHAVKPIS